MMMIKKPSVWRGSLLGLALGLMGLAGCSKPPEPVQAPVPAKPVVQAPVAPLEIPEIQIPTESESKNQALLKEYINQLRAGDLIQASANLSTLKSHIKGENLDDPFWVKNLPPESRRLLLIGALCSFCPDGACPVCKGVGRCLTCEGTGLCKACKGRGGEWQACQKCICPACHGNRACPDCRGRRYLACPACNGTGTGHEEKKFEPCTSCGGRGYKDGLKGPNGTSSRLKCLRCNGARGTYTTIRVPCATCGGSGQKNCATCRATGVCPSCRGIGRLSTCSVCGGQGRFLDPCPICKGAKVCQTCQGSKNCQACKGQGVCHDCLGRNLVIRYRFPIDQRWLAQPEARVFHPDLDKLVVEPLPGTTISMTINNRKVTAEVPADALLWASASQDLRRIRELFKPEP